MVGPGSGDHGCVGRVVLDVVPGNWLTAKKLFSEARRSFSDCDWTAKASEENEESKSSIPHVSILSVRTK